MGNSSVIWRRLPSTFLAVTTIFGWQLLFSAPSVAQVKSLVFRNPLRIMTCEMLLRALPSYRTNQSVLASLREVKYAIEKAIPDSKSDGIGFSWVVPETQLRLAAWNRITAIATVERINGIEENLVSTNPDVQLIAYEVRGRAIVDAVHDIERSESGFANSYHGSKFQPNPALLVGSIALNTVINSLGPTIALDYNARRFDTTFKKLMKFLVSINSAPQHRDRIFVSATDTIVPYGFHGMLMRNSDESFVTGRAEGMEMWGQNLAMQMLRDIPQIFNRYEYSFRSYRHIFIDHIVYFDDEKKEPVWVFVYRAFRDRPASRKPKKVRAPSTRRHFAWATSLLPAPARGK